LLKADAANECANLRKVPGRYICVVMLKSHHLENGDLVGED
jgi:hypothetical protein